MGELLTWLRKLADGRVVVDNGCGRPEQGREAGRDGRDGVGRSAVISGEGGESALSFTPFLQLATANGESFLKGLTLR